MKIKERVGVLREELTTIQCHKETRKRLANAHERTMLPRWLILETAMREWEIRHLKNQQEV